MLEETQTEIVIHRSRFIACARKTDTQEEVRSFLSERRNLHPQANHNVWAYILDQSSGRTYDSDDGEPRGTAGPPVMGVLRSNSLEWVMVVVTRYFGGILLGRDGLIEAYRSSTLSVLEASKIVLFSPHVCFRFCIPYPEWSILKNRVKNLGILEENFKVEFLERIHVELTVPLKLADAVQQVFASFSQTLTPSHEIAGDYPALPFGKASYGDILFLTENHQNDSRIKVSANEPAAFVHGGKMS